MNRFIVILFLFMACAVPPKVEPGSTPQIKTYNKSEWQHFSLREKIAQMIMVRIRGDYYHSEHWYRKSLKKWLLKEYPFLEDIFEFKTDGEEITISIPGTTMTKAFTGDPYRGVFYDADKRLGNAIMKYLKESFDAWKTTEIGKASKTGDIESSDLDPTS